jgi:hypothetical protein
MGLVYVRGAKRPTQGEAKMPVFIVIREGPSAERSKPIFLTDDPQLLASLGRQIARRLGADAPARLAELSRRRRSDSEPGDPERS